MKKLISLILVAVLLCAFGASALAAAAAPPTYTITIENTEEGHTYTAYQVFAGDLSIVDDVGTLSNIVWGDGVDGEDLLDALQADSAFVSESVNAFAACVTAADVANVLDGKTDDGDFAQAFAAAVSKNLGTAAGYADTVDDTENAYLIEGLDAGYYFVKDSLASGSQYALSRYILKVVKNETVSPKSANVPTADKTITDVGDDAVTGTGKYAIGDFVPFVLTATLPESATYVEYAAYKLVFHDTLDAGLIAPAASAIAVTYKNTDDTAEQAFDDGDYAVSVDTVNNTITVSFTDTKDAGVTAEGVIYVRYAAALNTSAVALGTENTLTLEFSNDPNYTPAGTESDNPPTGTTPPVVTTNYLFNLTVNKTYDGTPDTQAAFTLYKGSDVVEEAKTVVDGAVSWAKLPDGTYTLKESYTPAGYNTMPDKTFTVSTAADGTITVTGDDAEDFEVVDSTATLETDVLNTTGTVLPATGGFGTMLLIGFGCALFLATAIVLVTKKRMYNEGC